MEKLLMLVLPAMLCGFVGCSAYGQGQADKLEAAADSANAFESFFQSLPDSVKTLVESKSLYDNLKDCFDNHKDKLSQMPIFKPDTSLTASMPILKTPPVDEEMIVPRKRGCK